MICSVCKNIWKNLFHFPLVKERLLTMVQQSLYFVKNNSLEKSILFNFWLYINLNKNYTQIYKGIMFI